MKKKIEIEIDVPDGYEFDRWGVAEKGEDVLTPSGAVLCCMIEVNNYSIILRKVKRYRTPTLPEDGGKQVEVLDPSGQWVQALLRGWRSYPFTWIAWTRAKGELAYADCRIEVTE